MKKYLFLICLIGSFSFIAKAQVYPPNFRCVQNDTLRWDISSNSCGIFQRYLIYGSQSLSGPYIQIAALNNINTTTFFHLHPAGQSWYYFMQARHDCPGQPIISSDTLNGASPDTPELRSISIENGKAVVEWTPLPDKRINAYIVYKRTANGVKAIDTVFNDNKLIDANSTPDKNRESYFVLSMDRCGSTSIFGKPHQSLAIVAKEDECERSVILSWNKYREWNATLRHEIWVKKGNLPYVKADTIVGTDTTYTYKGLKDKEKYCFYIRSVSKDNPKITSKTPEACVVGNLVESTEFIVLKNLEVNLKNEVTFTWIWNNTADLDSIKIKRAVDGTNFKDISSLPIKNVSAELTFTDKTPIGNTSEYYGIYTLDFCGNFVFAPFATLNIKGEPQDNRSNKLTWTSHFLETDKADFELYKVVKGVETKIWDATNKFEFIDPFDPLNPDNASICYYIVAYDTDTLPNGKPIRVRSKSNTVCVSQVSAIFTPNAFAPRGVNQEFRPKLSFVEQVQSYNMEIFDRSGAKVFETQDFTIGWNGKIQNTGKELQQDAYVYYIKVVQKNGKINESKGTVMLIR